jgi:hypothetical protein
LVRKKIPQNYLKKCQDTYLMMNEMIFVIVRKQFEKYGDKTALCWFRSRASAEKHLDRVRKSWGWQPEHEVSGYEDIFEIEMVMREDTYDDMPPYCNIFEKELKDI